MIALDTDEAGEAAVSGVADALLRADCRRVLRLRWPPGSKDACDVLTSFGIDYLKECLLGCLQ